MEERILNFLLQLLTYGSYPLTILLVLLTGAWASERVKETEFNFTQWLKAEKLPLLIALILTLFNGLSNPPRFRVLSDHANLATTAQSLVYDGSMNVVFSEWQFYRLRNPINYSFPNRPILYPFLVTIAHLFTGVRLANSFAINALLFVALISSFLIYFRRRGSLQLGVACVFLWYCHPIFTDSASGAGYDLLAIVTFIGCSFLLKDMVLKTTPASVGLFLCGLGLLAQCRQESPLTAILLGSSVLIWPAARGTLKDRRLKWTLAALTLTGMPLVIHKFFWDNPYLYWDPTRPTAKSFIDAFNPGFFSAHVWAFWDFLFIGLTAWTWKISIPYSFLSFWVGIFALLFTLWLNWRKWDDRISVRTLLSSPEAIYKSTILIAFIVTNWIYFAHYRGLIDSLTEARFFLLLATGFAFWVGHAVLQAQVPKRIIPIVLSLATGLLILEHTTPVFQRYTNLLYIIRETERDKEVIPRLSPDPAFVIHARSNIFTSDGFSGADFYYFNQNVEAISRQIRMHLVPKVYAVQMIDYKTNQPIEGTFLDHKFIRKPIYEFEYNTDAKMMISEVTVPEQ